MSESGAATNSSLGALLRAGGFRLRAFDLGRRIVPLTDTDLQRFEAALIPYPLPFQRHAWLALLVEDQRQETDPQFWFLRLPLDELGLLVLEARDDLLRQLAEPGAQRSAAPGPAEAGTTYGFRPRPDRMALVHAKAARELQQPPSQHYAHARRYFTGELGWDQWPFLALQGIADLAVRLREDRNSEAVARALPGLPGQPLIALCQCLENEPIDVAIAHALHDRAQREMADNGGGDPAIIAACICGASHAPDSGPLRRLVRQALRQEGAQQPEVLRAVSSRAWTLLWEPDLRMRYLERLAVNHQGQPVFDEILSDLLFVPGMREPILQSLRDTQRSATLTQAIGGFFAGLQPAR